MSIQPIVYEPVSGKLNAGYRANSLKPLAPEFGGTGSTTGVVKTSSTTYSVTVTATANTTLTVPTSGTLATTADVASLIASSASSSQTKQNVTVANALTLRQGSNAAVTNTGTTNIQKFTNGNIEHYVVEFHWQSGGASVDPTLGAFLDFSIRIASTVNDTFYFNASSFVVAAGYYSPEQLCTAVQNGLIGAGLAGATATYSYTTNKFTVAAPTTFTLPFATNTSRSIGATLAFTTDQATALSHVSDSTVIYIKPNTNLNMVSVNIHFFSGITMTYPAASSGNPFPQLTAFGSTNGTTGPQLALYGPNATGWVLADAGNMSFSFTMFRL